MRTSTLANESGRSASRAQADARGSATLSRVLVIERAGLVVLRYGLVFLLLLFGALKFTAMEAEGIRPLLANSPLMSWMYSVFSVRTASALLGVFELSVGLAIATRRFLPRVSGAASLAAAAMFVITLSFLVTTPGVLEPTSETGGFLLKDLILLGAALLTGAEALLAGVHYRARSARVRGESRMKTMGDEAVIRPARRGDLPGIVPLAVQIVRQHEGYDRSRFDVAWHTRDASIEERHSFLGEQLTRQGAVILVAEQAGDIVGQRIRNIESTFASDDPIDRYRKKTEGKCQRRHIREAVFVELRKYSASISSAMRRASGAATSPESYRRILPNVVAGTT